jgi:hypothetical protein
MSLRERRLSLGALRGCGLLIATEALESSKEEW